MTAKVLLFDTYSLFFRAHHALPPMSTRAGEPTSALYGFSALLLKLLREHRGAELAFALDAPSATFRHEAFEGYKASRDAVPDVLQAQFRRLDELLSTLEVPGFRVPGFEADDVLATLARDLRASDRPTLIVSGDRDLLQLVHGSVQVLFMGRRGKDALLYDERAVRARFGLPAQRLPAYFALVGEPSDDLPGVPGIGPGTAARLLRDVGSVEELLARLESAQPAKIREALRQHREQILLGERLATLRDDLDLGPGLRHAAPSSEALLRLRGWFEELEMKSLLPRVDALLRSSGTNFG